MEMNGILSPLLNGDQDLRDRPAGLRRLSTDSNSTKPSDEHSYQQRLECDVHRIWRKVLAPPWEKVR